MYAWIASKWSCARAAPVTLSLPAVAHKLAALGIEAKADPTVPQHAVVIGRPADPAPVVRRPEGYGLRIDQHGVALRGADVDSLFWGLVTLEQSLRGGRMAPCAVIRDWPAFPFRFHHDDISRKQVSTVADFRRIVRLLSSYKIRYYPPYREDMLFLPSHPDIGLGRGRLLPAEVGEILAEARLRNVTVFPTFSLIGHQENLLSNLRYRRYAREVFQPPSSFDPAKSPLRPFLRQVIADVCTLFPDAPYFHVHGFVGFRESALLQRRQALYQPRRCAVSVSRRQFRTLLLVLAPGGHARVPGARAPCGGPSPQGEALRRRANAKLFFGNHYGHMIPEDGRHAKAIYALVGDERERMSFSTGYTINRGMATHDMAVKVLDEYQHRGRRLRRSSFAEWWSMDPMYTEAQWPRHGNADLLAGGFMNGAISPIVAGELAKAAFDHGREAYGVDILGRLWTLSERDGGHLHDSYLRLPGNPPPPCARFRAIDIRGVVNRGLPSVKVPVSNMRARSRHFLHTQAYSVPVHAVIGRYTVQYADGTAATIWIRNGHEIGHWWGCTDKEGAVDRATTRVAWRGANPTWWNVGIHMFGWNNPHPEKPIVAVVLEACTPTAGRGGILLAAISASDAPVSFETNIRSYGIPPCWAQAAVYYALAEGLAGIEDQGRVFSHVQISPRWAATTAKEADVTLHYPASDGYCAYRYRLNTRRRELTLDLTGAFETANVRCLLPAGVRTVTSVRLGANELPYALETIEQSRYVTFRLESLPAMPVRIRYRHV